jgi:four helix bundle protein
MKENVVKIKSFAFAVKIVKLYQQIVKDQHEYVLSKQLLKSATSIGANVEEADAGISTNDFSSKISIAYKEAKETQYWLRLMNTTGYIQTEKYNELANDCEEICKLLFSILKTTRINKQ